jgi:hypothetical protein
MRILKIFLRWIIILISVILLICCSFIAHDFKDYLIFFIKNAIPWISGGIIFFIFVYREELIEIIEDFMQWLIKD